MNHLVCRFSENFRTYIKRYVALFVLRPAGKKGLPNTCVNRAGDINVGVVSSVRARQCELGGLKGARERYP